MFFFYDLQIDFVAGKDSLLSLDLVIAIDGVSFSKEPCERIPWKPENGKNRTKVTFQLISFFTRLLLSFFAVVRSASKSSPIQIGTIFGCVRLIVFWNKNTQALCYKSLVPEFSQSNMPLVKNWKLMFGIIFLNYFTEENMNSE